MPGRVTYQVDVADNGEPGRNDSFKLHVSGGYDASGTLGGGNIQLHQPVASSAHHVRGGRSADGSVRPARDSSHTLTSSTGWRLYRSEC